MKNIKDKSKVKFIEEKIELEKNNAIARYGIIQLIEIPSDGENVSTPKWFEDWCTEHFDKKINSINERIDNLQKDFYLFKEETNKNINSLRKEFNERIDNLQEETNKKFDNLVSKNKLKI